MNLSPHSKPWVNRFAFHRKNAKDAFVDSAKRLLTNKSFEGFDAEGELAES